jgi:hypothetical protein
VFRGDKSGSKDLLREFGNSQRSSPEPHGEDDVGRAENPFSFLSAWVCSCYVDDPRPRSILFGGCDGGRGPDVEFHGAGVGLEPIGQLFKGIEGKFRSAYVVSRTFRAGVHTGQFGGNLVGSRCVDVKGYWAYVREVGHMVVP